MKRAHISWLVIGDDKSTSVYNISTRIYFSRDWNRATCWNNKPTRKFAIEKENEALPSTCAVPKATHVPCPLAIKDFECLFAIENWGRWDRVKSHGTLGVNPLSASPDNQPSDHALLLMPLEALTTHTSPGRVRGPDNIHPCFLIWVTHTRGCLLQFAINYM